MKNLNSKRIRKFALILCTCTFFSFSYAQDYYHGLGGQIDMGFFSLEYTTDISNFSETSNPTVPGIFYKATLALTDQFAISAYPFVGFSGSANSRTGATGSVGIQLPVLAEMYFGDFDDVCFFAGAGLAFGSLGSSDFGSGTVLGPQFSIGGQLDLGGRLIGIRGAYTYGVNKSDAIENVEFTKDTHALVSLGVYYLLGQ